MQKDTTVYKSSTGFTIRVNRGSIWQNKVNIIVNITNQDIDLQISPLGQLVNDGELTHDLLHNISTECRSKAPSGLEIGEYVVTNVGTGSGVKYIYHGCLMDHKGKIDFQAYVNLIKECLEVADCMGYQKLVIPIMGLTAFSQTKLATEQHLATHMIDTCISSMINDAYLQQMSLHFVVPAKSTLFKVYKEVLDDLNKQTSAASAQPIPDHTLGDNQSWNLSTMTQSLDTSMRGGVKPKRFNRTNSTGNDIEPDLNNTQTFPGRNDRRGSSSNQPKSRNSAIASGIDIFPSRKENSSEDSQHNHPQSTGNGSQRLAMNTKVYKGDITRVNVDAIVHGTTYIATYIDMTGVVGKALIKTGGSSFEKACNSLGANYSKRGFVVTKAGSIKAKHVIHVNTSFCKHAYEWKTLIWNVLEKANEMKLGTLAFTAIGAANVGANIQATNFRETIEEFFRDTSRTLKEVHIVLYHESVLKTYQDVMNATGTALVPTRTRNNPTSERPNIANQPGSVPTNSKGTSGPSGGGVLNLKYRGFEITVKEGDITNELVGCIVHGFTKTSQAYSKISLNDAVGIALEKKMGSQLTKKCDSTFVTAGQIDVTPGYSVCLNVMHIEISKYTARTKPTWNEFIRNCLGKAKDKKIYSIAFPVIGSFRTSVDTLAQQQIAGIKDYIDYDTGSVMDIRFIIYKNQDHLKLFKDAALTLTNIATTNTPPASGSVSRKTMHRIKYKHDITLELAQGDLTTEMVDAIVHGTTSSIDLKGNFGELLRKAGGKKFESDCYAASFKNGKATCFTNAGVLQCVKVLHVNLFAYRRITEKHSEKIDRLILLIYECLDEANRQQLQSLAFPAIGTVSLKCSAKEVAACFKIAVQQFCDNVQQPFLKDIRIIIFDSTIAKEFAEKLNM